MDAQTVTNVVLLCLTGAGAIACHWLLRCIKREQMGLERRHADLLHYATERVKRYYNLDRANDQDDPVTDFQILADWLADNGEPAAADKVRGAFPMKSDSRAIARGEDDGRATTDRDA